jgi:hypothetical protein
MNPQTPPVVTVLESQTAEPPAAPGLLQPRLPSSPANKETPPYTPAVINASRKRKIMVDMDYITGYLNVIPDDYKAAWNKLRTHLEEISIPTVGFFCI